MLLPQESSPFAVRHRAAGSHKGRGRPSSQQAWAGGSWSQSRMRRPAAWRKRSSAGALAAVRGRGDDRHGVQQGGHMAAQAVAAAPVPGQQADDETAVRRDDQDRRVRALVFQQGRHGPHGDACCAYKDLGNFCGLPGCIHDAGKRQAVFSAKRCGADRRHSASVSPDGPRHGAAAMASRRRRASGKAALLRT